MTRENLYYWDEETNDWFNWRIIEQTFLDDDADHLTRSLWKNWNKTYQNWSGVEEYNGEICRNKLTENSYDKQKRQISSKYSEGYTAAANEDETGYILGAFSTTEWTTIEGDLTQRVETNTTCTTPDNPREDQIIDIATWHYDSMGREVYFFEKHINPELTELVDYQTIEYTYENDNLIRQYMYVFKAKDASCTTFTYDNFHNVLTQTSRHKSEQGNNEENWTNSNYFEYTWDLGHDLLVDKKAYFWNGVEWSPNWGAGDFYDFEADMSTVNMWPGANTKYKLLESRSYVNNDGDWDWLSYKYYYSPAPTGIENQISDENIKVYPNPVVDMLYINSQENTEINLYNMQGSKLLNTNEKKIDMIGYPTGLYIIDVNGTKTKILKK